MLLQGNAPFLTWSLYLTLGWPDLGRRAHLSSSGSWLTVGLTQAPTQPSPSLEALEYAVLVPKDFLWVDVFSGKRLAKPWWGSGREQGEAPPGA